MRRNEELMPCKRLPNETLKEYRKRRAIEYKKRIQGYFSSIDEAFGDAMGDNKKSFKKAFESSTGVKVNEKTRVKVNQITDTEDGCKRYDGNRKESSKKVNEITDKEE